jgi:hypothetical protein
VAVVVVVVVIIVLVGVVVAAAAAADAKFGHMSLEVYKSYWDKFVCLLFVVFPPPCHRPGRTPQSVRKPKLYKQAHKETRANGETAQGDGATPTGQKPSRPTNGGPQQNPILWFATPATFTPAV